MWLNKYRNKKNDIIYSSKFNLNSFFQPKTSENHMEKKSVKSQKSEGKRKHEPKEPVPEPVPEVPSAEAIRLMEAEQENQRLKKVIEEMQKEKAKDKAESGKIPAGIAKKVNFIKKVCGKLPDHELYFANLSDQASTYKDWKDVIEVERALLKQLLEAWPEVKQYNYMKEPKDKKNKEKKQKKLKITIEKEDDDEVPSNQEAALESSNFFID